MVERLRHGGIFLMNTPYGADEIWPHLPREVQTLLNERQARFYVINAQQIARECWLGARINTVMQMAFFQLSGILPPDTALSALQQAVAKSYSSKGTRAGRAQLEGSGGQGGIPLCLKIAQQPIFERYTQ